MTNEDIFTGIPSSYEDIYQSFVFLACLYLAGDVFCRRCSRIVPSLVGHIAVGVLLGPAVANYVSFPESWVMWGNMGLVLLICQAGLEMDLDILRLIGIRGVIMAVVGSIMPIGLAMMISYFVLGDTGTTVVAVGCSFGPTSAGIAMNVLGQNGVLSKPVGQLIVAAAIVDDILALVVLSLLRSLTTEGDIDVLQVIIPIISAFLWLGVGGTIALFVAPRGLEKIHGYWIRHKPQRLLSLCGLESDGQDAKEEKTTFALILLLVSLMCLLPATFYTQASYLLGAFLSGLAFCQQPMLDASFRRQFKRLVQWMMRFFFAASIGFQVPVSLFDSGTVIANGFLLSLALLGKVAVGPLLTPVFKTKKGHARDVAIVGFSMAGEAEFAFVVAVFGLNEGLIPPDRYASVVWAILMSTVLSPLALRLTLAVSSGEDDGSDDDSSSIDQGGQTRQARNDEINTSDGVSPESLLPRSSFVSETP